MNSESYKERIFNLLKLNALNCVNQPNYKGARNGEKIRIKYNLMILRSYFSIKMYGYVYFVFVSL